MQGAFPPEGRGSGVGEPPAPQRGAQGTLLTFCVSSCCYLHARALCSPE